MTMHWRMLSADQKVEAIKAVYVPGMSAAKIAASIGGVTRNAVIGVYTRYGPQLMDCPLNGAQSKSMTPQAQKFRGSLAVNRAKNTGGLAAVNAVRRAQRWATAPGLSHLKIVCAEVEPPLNISLMDLERHHCRWPVTDDGPHLFCGRDKAEGSSYCAGHARLSVGRGTEGERSADRTLLAAA